MDDCQRCASWSEERRCPECGMTGREIVEARKVLETGQDVLF